MSNNVMGEIIDEIKKAESIVIMSHKNMDGDAMGALLAMGHLCRNEFGKMPVLVHGGVIPDNLRFLSNGWWLKKTKDIIQGSVFDLAILLDTADIDSLLDDEGREIFNNAKRKIKIDHHVNSRRDGDINVLMPVAATCEIIADFALENNCVITPAIARFLYAGIFTDTGGLIFDYTTAKTTMIIAKLLETGFDHAETVRRLFEKKMETFRNNTETLARTMFTDDGKIGYTTFSIKKVNETDRPHRETDWLHRQIMFVHGVEATVVFKEMDAPDTEGRIMISLRGKTRSINGFAEQFGGGGHSLAAGFMFEGAMNDAIAEIIPKLHAFIDAVV